MKKTHGQLISEVTMRRSKRNARPAGGFSHRAETIGIIRQVLCGPGPGAATDATGTETACLDVDVTRSADACAEVQGRYACHDRIVRHLPPFADHEASTR